VSNPPTTTLEAATRYVASGYRVIPIKPLQKRPPMNEWTQVATSDPSTVTAWWGPGGVYADHGIGLALGWQPTPYGDRCVFAIDLDQHDPENNGHESWARLLAEHGDTPETVTALTAGGGIHLLFAAESNVTNKMGMLPGIDVRGAGGQIAVFPTPHPTKACKLCVAGLEHELADYRWQAEHEPWWHDVADAPDWLLELVASAPEPERREVVLPNAPRPGARIDMEKGPADILREHWNWQDRLAREGWTFSHMQGSDEHWTRPGKDVRAGASAVLHPNTGILVVFSTDESMRTLHSTGTRNPDGSVSLTPFHFFAATRHGGDTSAAAGVIRRQHNREHGITPGIQPPPSSPTSQLVEQTGPRIIDPDDDDDTPPPAQPPVEDLGLIDWNEAFGNHAPEVAILEGLLFPGRWTAFVAAAKSGKSTLMLHIAHCLARGIHPFKPGVMLPDGAMNVLYLDGEMGRLDTVGRLTMVGLTAADLDNLAYTDLPHKFDNLTDAGWLARACNLVQPSVVILDGINAFVTGAEKDDLPWRMLYEYAIAPLKQAGIAVISTDNTGKDQDAGGRGSTVKTDKADAIMNLRGGRDEYHNFTTVITRRQARTGSFTSELVLRVDGVGTGKISYTIPGTSYSTPPPIVSREDILRVCRTLVGLGLPPSASVAESERELRLTGFLIRKSLVQSAVEYRREGHPIDMDGEHLTEQSASRLLAELEAEEAEPDDPENLF
jgi:hypothetical protein